MAPMTGARGAGPERICAATKPSWGRGLTTLIQPIDYIQLLMKISWTTESRQPADPLRGPQLSSPGPLGSYTSKNLLLRAFE